MFGRRNTQKSQGGMIMKKKIIICEVGLPEDTDDDTIVQIMDILYMAQKHPKVIYVDQSVEEVEEEE